MVESSGMEIRWHKSQASGLNGCIEVGRTAEYIYVRDSKDPNKARLRLNGAQWIYFIEKVKDGVFDLVHRSALP